MDFFKRYGIPLLAAVLMIALAVVIGGGRIQKAANSDYYERWVIDDALLLSQETKQSFGAVNETLDRKYGSLAGVITVRSLNGQEISKAVYTLGEASGFGQNDLVLLISVEDRQWYLGYGDQIAQYADQALRLLFIENLDDRLYDGKADAELGTLLGKLPDWYAKHVPQGGTSMGRRSGISGRGFLKTLLRFVITAYIVVTLFRFLVYPLFTRRRTNGWSPLGGWVIFPILALLFRGLFRGSNGSGDGAGDGGNFGSSDRGSFG